MKPEGLTMRWSRYAPRETADRLAQAIVEHGMVVHSRVDQAGVAARAGLSLRPKELLLFGDAGLELLMMQSANTVAIDLPFKALVWQDGDANTCVAYYDPLWLLARHTTHKDIEEQVRSIALKVTAAVQTATKGSAAGT